MTSGCSALANTQTNPLEHGLKPQFGIDGREDRYGRLWADQSSEGRE